MKRLLLSFMACALLTPAVQLARGADVSMNFFYDNLNGGSWYQVADYGYVWQPDVASDANWRPYTDGYWAYTDEGWTWVSYEDFGWATYHYGRWARLADYGWVWVPGYEWGPAWVSWRTGGDYVGWAPLPPAGNTGETVYEGRPITGPVDVEFGIGPAYYNFIDLRYIGEPVLRERIYPYTQNLTYMTNTVNVTNITYNNGVVYNYGPDYATLNSYSTRPIQRLTIQRENIDPLRAVRTGSVTKVQGNKLLLAAPPKLQKTNAQIAPKRVKAKIEQPKIEKGWANISDPNTKAQLEQKFRSENRKDIPKPDIQPKERANAASNVNASPAGAAAGPATGSEAAGHGKGHRNAERAAQRQVPNAASAGASAAPERARGRQSGRQLERSKGGSSPAGEGRQAEATRDTDNRQNLDNSRREARERERTAGEGRKSTRETANQKNLGETKREGRDREENAGQKAIPESRNIGQQRDDRGQQGHRDINAARNPNGPRSQAVQPGEKGQHLEHGRMEGANPVGPQNTPGQMQAPGRERREQVQGAPAAPGQARAKKAKKAASPAPTP